MGSTKYLTGEPCKHGHIAPRRTVSGSCTKCITAAVKAWGEKHPEKLTGYSKDYRARNLAEVRGRDRLIKVGLRATEPERVKDIKRTSYARVQAAQGNEVRPGNRLTEAEVAVRAQERHGTSLSYVRGYTGMAALAVFHCSAHQQEIEAYPHNVLRGANPCGRCNHMKSNGEAAIASFISTFTEVVARDRKLIKPYELDIYLPEHKLAVEYCGEYYHASATAEDESEARARHVRKHELCAAQGVRLLTIYETEWKTRAQQIKRLLRAAMGKLRGSAMARKCDLRAVDAPEARAFFDRYHVQGGAGTGAHWGLYWKDRLVACMRFGFGSNDRGTAEREWTLSRYATRISVPGGASRLFKAFLSATPGATTVKSFSDSRYFAGGMYEKLGFTLEESLPPDYMVWHPRLGLRPKSHYQRRQIPNRQRDLRLLVDFLPDSDARTERDMTYVMGCRRLFDCGKKRWTYTRS